MEWVVTASTASGRASVEAALTVTQSLDSVSVQRAGLDTPVNTVRPALYSALIPVMESRT